MDIPLTKPTIGAREVRAAAAVLKSGWIIRGKETAALEKEAAQYVGAKHAIATQGCTMALHLGIKRRGIGIGDEVIVPSLTWNATAAVVVQAGATPVFADVRPDTWCLDPEDVRRKITSHTKLVIPVHFASRVAEGFDDFEVPVLFDSAHRTERDGWSGTDSCHSFYAVKNMTTIRGGMICTDNDEDAAWYLMAVHGGIAKDTLSRYVGSGARDASAFYYDVEYAGFNYDMTDVEAAVGRVQLSRLDGINAKRDAVVARYNRALGLANTGNHIYPVLVRDRDAFLVAMKEQGIRCGVHYLPLHLMSAYRGYPTPALPHTEFIGEHCASLPLYPSLTRAEQKYVIDAVQASGQLITDYR